jgi:hypothetical protein
MGLCKKLATKQYRELRELGIPREFSKETIQNCYSPSGILFMQPIELGIAKKQLKNNYLTMDEFKSTLQNINYQTKTPYQKK